MTWQFTLTGLLIGVLVGLTGMGGGSLMTPILVIVLGFKPTYAVGPDILHGAVFKSFGAVRHRRLGDVDAHLTLWMFLGSGPMSLLGVATAGWLADAYGDGVQSALSYAIGAALILGAIVVVLKTFVKRGVQPSEAAFIMQHKDRVRAVILGAVFGYIVGLTSVGSGTFFGLVMVMIYPLTIARIVGTDIFHAAALLWVAGIGHLVQGNVDLHAMGWLLLGSIPGVWLSSRYTLHLPQTPLRPGPPAVLALAVIADRTFPKGMVHVEWDGRGVPDGIYHAVVHMQRAQRTIDLPNPIRVDTVKPTITLVSRSRDGTKTLFRYRISEPAHALLFVNGERRIRTYYTVKRGKFAYAGRLTAKTRLVLRARDVAGNLSPPAKISSL